MDLVSSRTTAQFLQAHHHPSKGNPFTIVQAQVPPSDVYTQVLLVLDHALKKGILTVRSKSRERGSRVLESVPSYNVLKMEDIEMHHKKEFGVVALVIQTRNRIG